MGCKIARFAYGSDTAQAVAAGQSILFSNVVGKTRSIQGNGSGGIQLKTPGTYRAISSFTIDATAAGAVSVQMSKSNVAATGGRAGAAMAAAGDIATLPIVDYVTALPGASGSYATLTFSPGSGVGVRTASVLVEKACSCQYARRIPSRRMRLFLCAATRGEDFAVCN